MNETETNEETFSENEEIPLTKTTFKKTGGKGGVIGELSVPLNKGGRPKKEVAPKEKKPRTEKQIEAMKKAFSKRQENIELKKFEKKIEASKLLLSLDKPTLKGKKEVIEEEEESEESSDDEPQVVIIKKEKKQKPKPKKQKKQIIVYQQDNSGSDSDSDSDSDNDNTPKHFKTQKNKKSIIKVHQKPEKTEKVIKESYKNFFTD